MLAFKGILQKLKHRRRNVGAEAGRVVLPGEEQGPPSLVP